MPDPEAIGDALTGGVFARAVEPEAGKARDGRTHESNCLNCGCELTGVYCHCCGQHAHVHRTIAAWWHDFVHSVLHLDGKFWRTIPMLAWRPGELTRRYAHGERAKFISPLALFLFTVFLMFAVFSLAAPSLDLGMGRAIDDGIAEGRQAIERLQTERAEAPTAAAAAAIDRRIANAREDVAKLEDLRAKGVTRATFGTEAETISGDAWIRAAYRKVFENPELLLYKMQANAYKFSWALIPISVPFVWILFLHRRHYRQEFTAYDHLVFVTYSIAFMSLATVTFVLLGALRVGGMDDLLWVVFVIIAPLHVYRQLRGAYVLSRFSAAWRALALTIFAGVALSLFAALLLLLGVAA